MKQEGVSLADAVLAAVEAASHRMHTALPAKVIKVDAANRRVDVQLVFRGLFRTEEGELVDEKLPRIPHVPIGFYRTGNARIELPVNVGDWVTLLFYEWNIGEWLASGQTDISPGDIERHGLTGAVALPILFPDSTPIATPLDQSKMVIVAPTVRIEGDLEVTGEVHAKADTTPVGLTTHVHPTAMGPSSPPTPGS